jgi:hypothetical protein
VKVIRFLPPWNRTARPAHATAGHGRAGPSNRNAAQKCCPASHPFPSPRKQKPRLCGAFVGGRNFAVRKPRDRGASAGSGLTRLPARSCEGAALGQSLPRRSGSETRSRQGLRDYPAAELSLAPCLGIPSKSSVSRAVATRLPPRSIRAATRSTSSTLVGFRSPA